MKLSTKIVIAVLTLIGGSGAVYAFGKHGGWHMTPEEKVEFATDRVGKKLELDAAQRQKFTALAEDLAQIMVEVKAGRQQQLDAITALLQQPSFDQNQALQMVQQKTQLINDKAPQLIASLADFVDSLDSGQKAQLQEFLMHRRHHHRHADEN